MVIFADLSFGGNFHDISPISPKSYGFYFPVGQIFSKKVIIIAEKAKFPPPPPPRKFSCLRYAN